MASSAANLKPKRSVITGPQWLNQCKRIDVLDSHMSYFDSGGNSREAIIFLHGNATSSYMWRNIIPHLVNEARCLAPDLIGMGNSGKSGNGSYRFVDHYKYLSTWCDLVNLPDKVVLVCHDWGSALAFHWCHLNSARVKALVHMESLVMTLNSYGDMPETATHLQGVRSSAGEEMVLKNNVFVEKLLPWSIMRELEPEEMEAYLAPYKEEGECRRPTLTWPRECPIAGDGPADMIKITDEYQAFLRSSDLPKLFIEAVPGFFTKGIKKESLEWPNTSTVKVKGLHQLQEDSPDDIGAAIKSFIGKLN